MNSYRLNYITGSVIDINDISLPNGGKFDVFGSWNAPHRTHRVGRDAEIRTTRDLESMEDRNGILLTAILDANGNPETYPNGLAIYENALFEELAEQKGANPTPGVHFSISDGRAVGEHYHVYFYN